METLEITELKDSILLYLFDCNKWRISLSDIYSDLNLVNIPKEDVRNYVEHMVLDKLIGSRPMSVGRNFYYIMELGKMRLKAKGYKLAALFA